LRGTRKSSATLCRQRQQLGNWDNKVRCYCPGSCFTSDTFGILIEIFEILAPNGNLSVFRADGNEM
jgi:hypothetical protein